MNNTDRLLIQQIIKKILKEEVESKGGESIDVVSGPVPSTLDTPLRIEDDFAILHEPAKKE